MRSAHVLLPLALVLGCTVYQHLRLDRRHGDAAVRDRAVASLAAGAVDYETQVRPILEARCVVCHACYDAPCQLKLGSVEGLDRGASTEKVYDGTRLLQADPTRLFEDAHGTQAWRDKSFHPVLNERRQTRRANRDAGLLARLLELKRRHPVTPGALLPADVDLALRHDEQCPTIEAFNRHARRHPEWGMPYGLPGLTDAEHTLVQRWLEEGAVHLTKPDDVAPHAAEIATWETFLNDDALAAQLASRYIYEHLFLAHLHFDDGDHGAAPRYFELVRSSTPPGQPIERIATRRPYDDPRVSRPYYRISPVREAIVAKLHLPYRLDAARMKRWRALFRDVDIPLTKLPSYAPEVASNPFVAFRAIPVDSRYRFMLDEAEFTIMGFIKGAVCRGPIALNVIDDQFWVFFVDPDAPTRLHDGAFLDAQAKSLRMPAEASSNALPLATWLRQAEDERRWAHAKQRVQREDFAARGPDTEFLWDGDGNNPNAALTVFRHYDSASVVKGLVGAEPKTAWVISYPLLERIHYLLVAGFDVYGNVGHQLATRAYMDFLRMESEFAFLSLLPRAARARERDAWYRGTEERGYRKIVAELAKFDPETAITYRTEAPKHELYGHLAERVGAARDRSHDLAGARLPADLAEPLRDLAAIAGDPLSWVPQTAFLYVPDAPHGAQVFTLIRNDGHSNIASPFGEDERRRPTEDTLTVARGFVGTYPNAYFVVERARLPGFVDRIASLASEADYAAVQVDLGVRRTDPEFWPTSDRMVELYRSLRPIEAGLFDLARYENR